MSLVIKGMEMPKTCQICRTATFDRIVGCEEWDRLSIAQRMYMRSETCPLIPLPEGHGRLIDADALVLKYTEEITQLEEWAKIHEKEGRLDMFRASHLRSAYLAEAKFNVEAAPTIVPAEGGD